MVLDSLFLLLLTTAAAREIVAGRKWGNLKVVGIVILLALVNIVFHVEVHLRGSPNIRRALVITLVGVIGGRIVPSFTRNWLARRADGRMPVPFGRFDAATMAAGALALAAWIVMPSGRIVAAVLCVAGALDVVLLGRWAGERTLSTVWC